VNKSRGKKAKVPPPLKLQVADTYETMSRWAQELIANQLARQPNLLLCASAGGTPTRTYERLGLQRKSQPKLFSRLRVVQIDEWAGLPPGSPARCEADLQRKLLDPLAINSDRYFGFQSHAPDPHAECARMKNWLGENGPIDICILGLGIYGHVAMNEPAPAFSLGPHVAKLSRSSQGHPLLDGLAKKPRSGLTLGMSDILRSRKILLLVSGRHKRAALNRLLQPQVTTRFPASFLWLHPDATVLCDRAAAGNIKHEHRNHEPGARRMVLHLLLWRRGSGRGGHHGLFCGLLESVGRFMESLLSPWRMHWYNETRIAHLRRPATVAFPSPCGGAPA
jgi:galactosamine-6-phosphate isomerase